MERDRRAGRRRLPRGLRVLALAAACTALAAGPGSGSAAARLPVHYSAVHAGAYALAHPGAAPPGANNWRCKPSAAHPRPVVLVHGTFANMTENWTALSPLLRNHGYCVFALDYGANAYSHGFVYGLAHVAKSAGRLRTFVARVLSATGARRVDLVGHSQGGMMPRYYLRFLGGAAKVHALVGLAPSNHGTTLGALGTLARLWPGVTRTVVGSWCQSCTDQLRGSALLRKLNAGHEVEAGVSYTVIETRHDEVVTPYTSAWLSGARNVLLQSGCVLDASDHISVAFDRRALRDVLNALDPAHAVKAPCVVVLPGVGG